MVVLTPDQEAAAFCPASQVCVLACAGSGKTTILTRRLAHLLARDQADPSNIAAITFTTLAAEELLLRLAQLVPDQRALSQMFVGTIHSFCLNLIQDFADGRIQDLRVLDENQQFILLNLHWDDWEISHLAPRLSKRATIERLKASLDIMRMEQIAETAVRSQHAQLARVAARYDEYLNENRYLDFAGILVRVRDLLDTDADFLSSARDRYGWLFVDEYQDVDPVQESIIRMISDDQKLFVVGDDDQAIYQFRGTNVRNLLDFLSVRPQAEQKLLLRNRRCRKNVLAVAKSVIGDNQNRLPKQVNTKRPGGIIQFHRFDKVRQEAAYISNEIQRLQSQGLVDSYSEIAILLRSVASYGEIYLDALRAAGIPFISKGGRAMFRRPEITHISACLEFMVSEPLQLNSLNRLEPILGDVSSALDDLPQDLAILDPSLWKSLPAPSEHHILVERLIAVRDSYRQGKFESLLDIVYYVIDALNLLEPGLDDAVYYNTAYFTNLVHQFDEIEKTKKLHRLCAYLVMYASRQVDEATPIEAAGDAVRVLTVHQAKGLGFLAVFCPMLVIRRFPSSASSKRWFLSDDFFDAARYLTDIEDERRLFYVATTRARSYLYLLCSDDVGLKKPVTPSEFYLKSQSAALDNDQSVDALDPASGRTDTALTTSYSALEYYLTCPYRYELLSVYRFRLPVNPFFEFGRVVHSVAALLHLRYKSGQSIDDQAIEELYNANFRMRYRVPEYVLQRRRLAGLRALKRYWRNRRAWFDQLEAVELPFAYHTGGALIRGRMDLLLDTDTGYEIVDLKTGRPQDTLRRDFQMQTYSLAAREQLRLDVKRATLFYVESDQTESFDVTDGFLDQGARELSGVLNGIQERNFAPTPGPSCTRCEFKKPCPHRM